MNKTFLKYFFRIQLQTMFVITCFIIGFIFIFTFADTIRKIPSDAVSPVILCSYLSILRVPYTFCELVGYVYLIAATYSLWNLSQSHQITVLKSIGKSSKQILLPYFILSGVLSLFFVFVLHPLCVSSERFADSQDKVYLSKSDTYSSDIWMHNAAEKKLIYFGKLSKNTACNLYISDYGASEDIYAESVAISDKIWKLNNGYVYNKQRFYYFVEKSISSPVNRSELELYEAPPQRCSIYTLLRCLLFEKSYKSDYVININKILSAGISFFLFSIVAAVVCLPLNRYKTKTFVSGSIIGVAVLLRLLNNICESMGSNGTLSPSICIWLPVVVAFLLATALLIWKEE